MVPLAAPARRREYLPIAVLRLASDERLVAQVRAGSERAFEALFERHHLPVLAFCRHMLGSHEDAEDAVQHTFLAAYRDLMRSEKPIALRPWLYTIARHRCLSVVRARRECPALELRAPATEDPAAEAVRREDMRLVLADVARLPDDQRAALVLTQLGDVSHEQIAQVLGCPQEKVKALVFQARSALNAGRAARDTSCAEIRQQLSTLRGSPLRRPAVRRHLHHCPGCREFRDAMRGQRRELGLLLPVIPTVGLKRTVLGAVFGSSGSGAVTAGALSGTGLVVTALVAATIPASGIAAAVSTPVTRGESPQALAARVVGAHRGATAPVIDRRRGGHARDVAARDQATPANDAEPADPNSEPASAVTRTGPAGHSVDGGSQPPASEDVEPDRPAAPPRANGQGAPAGTGERIPPRANGEGRPAGTGERIPPHASGEGKPATTGERIPPHANGEDKPAEASEPAASSPPTRPEQPQDPPKPPPADPPAARAAPNPSPASPGAAGDGRPDSKRPSGGGG